MSPGSSVQPKIVGIDTGPTRTSESWTVWIKNAFGHGCARSRTRSLTPCAAVTVHWRRPKSSRWVRQGKPWAVRSYASVGVIITTLCMENYHPVNGSFNSSTVQLSCRIATRASARHLIRHNRETRRRLLRRFDCRRSRQPLRAKAKRRLKKDVEASSSSPGVSSER
jgi:hypothetical protein